MHRSEIIERKYRFIQNELDKIKKIKSSEEINKKIAEILLTQLAEINTNLSCIDFQLSQINEENKLTRKF